MQGTQSQGEQHTETREERWKVEAEFFDRSADAAAARLEPVSEKTLARYGRRRRRRFEKEYRFRVLGDLAGKRVLDVGCGDGTNAAILARLGAQVTGIDVSPRAIEVAEARARINGVAERTRFVCAPLETTRLEPASFDIVWVDAVLHHLLADLDAVLGKLAALLRPGGEILIAEPVNLSPGLRRLRFALPIHTEHTPDERPLEPAELALVRKHFPGVAERYFSVFARLGRFVLVDYNYEESSWIRRAAFGAICALDHVLLALPPLRRFAGYVVLHGARPASAG